MLDIDDVVFVTCRIGKVGSQKRVVGVLLGSWQKKILDVSNSFAGVSVCVWMYKWECLCLWVSVRVRASECVSTRVSECNCFAPSHLDIYKHAACSSTPVPFDEDDKDDSVWFLDHDYLENMYGMFKKVNGKSSSYRNPCHSFTLNYTWLSVFSFQPEKESSVGTTPVQNCTRTTLRSTSSWSSTARTRCGGRGYRLSTYKTDLESFVIECVLFLCNRF